MGFLWKALLYHLINPQERSCQYEEHMRLQKIPSSPAVLQLKATLFSINMSWPQQTARCPLRRRLNPGQAPAPLWFAMVCAQSEPWPGHRQLEGTGLCWGRARRWLCLPGPRQHPPFAPANSRDRLGSRWLGRNSSPCRLMLEGERSPNLWKMGRSWSIHIDVVVFTLGNFGSRYLDMCMVICVQSKHLI